jgi:type IV pilus assembly protein PilF
MCLLGITIGLSGCVTQQYADENTPIVQNEVSNNEIALTRISLGLGYLKMGNTTQAKLNLEKAKHYAPNLVQVHAAFAHYYEYVGEPELAEQAFNKALSIKADDADTLNNYGVFLCRQHKIEQAKQQWLKAVAVPSYTQVSETYENLANCLLGEYQFDEAEFYFHKAVDHSPTNASAILQLTQLYYAKGQYAQAEQLISRYEKNTRRFTPAALALSYQVFKKRGKTDIAQNYAAMLLKMFPQSLEAKQFLLNGLSYTEADKLADQYLLYQQAQQTNKKPKRVVKLSPSHDIHTTEHEKSNQTTAHQAEKSALTFVDDANTNTTKNATVTVEQKRSESNPEPSQTVTSNPQTTINIPVHVVQMGDSLFSISKHYNIRLSSLLRWNQRSLKSVLKIGDVIYLSDPKTLVKSND